MALRSVRDNAKSASSLHTTTWSVICCCGVWYLHAYVHEGSLCWGRADGLMSGTGKVFCSLPGKSNTSRTVEGEYPCGKWIMGIHASMRIWSTFNGLYFLPLSLQCLGRSSPKEFVESSSHSFTSLIQCVSLATRCSEGCATIQTCLIGTTVYLTVSVGVLLMLDEWAMYTELTELREAAVVLSCRAVWGGGRPQSWAAAWSDKWFLGCSDGPDVCELRGSLPISTFLGDSDWVWNLAYLVSPVTTCELGFCVPPSHLDIRGLPVIWLKRR